MGNFTVGDWDYIKRLSEDITDEDLEERIVRLYTISNYRWYTRDYQYREAVRLAKLENGKDVILCIHGYHYDALNRESAIESNNYWTKKWKTCRKECLGKKLKEVVELNPSDSTNEVKNTA